MVRHWLIPILSVAIVTTFLGELKMTPISGESFRFSLGTVAFFFGIIWFPAIPIWLLGLAVSVVILLFRTPMSVTFHDMGWTDALYLHIPAALFYIVFALVLEVLRIRKRLQSPLIGGILGAVGELAGNCGELLTRFMLGEKYVFEFHFFVILAIFSIVRPYFAIGIYNMLMVKQMRAVGLEQQRRMEKLLLINTGLHEERIWLQKLMTHIEELTREGYELYRRTNRYSQEGLIDKELSGHVLAIAEQIHEVKKDSRRVLVGLSKIIKQEDLTPSVSLATVVELVIRNNKQLAEQLGKTVLFTHSTSVSLVTNRVYRLLSIFKQFSD